jgi:two-component system response regulator AtoC
MRILLTWSEWHVGRPQLPANARDPGPVRRLLAVGGIEYDAIWLLTTRADKAAARALASELGRQGPAVSVEALEVTDPSDHEQLFTAVLPVVRTLPPEAEIDVLLSSGTPQAQTIWVVLVKAGLLRARMLQVIPPQFVPHPHPEPVREVRLDFDGFPEIRALREEVMRLRARVRAVSGGLLGESPAMVQLVERIARVAGARVPVLIHGETGTGKELVARAVHAAGDRAQGPFVAENCGAFAEGVLASELFGHEAGAFTGAVKRRRGLFEQAEGGTLFLDEVGELSPRVQVQLLRVLQEGVVRRVGGEAPVPVDCRIIAATHRDLPAMIARGEFREDLFYRLQGAVLTVPPLRDRRGDLEALVAHFQAETHTQHLRLTRPAWAALQAYDWPGNVRELRAEVARWGVFCDAHVQLEDVSAAIRQGAPPYAPAPAGTQTHASGSPSAPEDTTLDAIVTRAERDAVAAALAATDDNLSAAARRLGIDRNTLKRKMAAYGWR